MASRVDFSVFQCVLWFLSSVFYVIVWLVWFSSFASATFHPMGKYIVSYQRRLRILDSFPLTGCQKCQSADSILDWHSTVQLLLSGLQWGFKVRSNLFSPFSLINFSGKTLFLALVFSMLKPTANILSAKQWRTSADYKWMKYIWDSWYRQKTKVRPRSAPSCSRALYFLQIIYI